MNVLITGGAGFIGSAFVRRSVIARPDTTFINVDALTYAANLRSVEPVAHLPNYRFERVDVADADAVERLFATYDPELVVHFAAESHVDRSISGPAAFVRANVTGTFQLLDACRRRWGRERGRFHHVSTDEVYGSLGPTGLFTEDSRYDPSSPYSASKAASDHFVRAYARTYGLRTSITNCSNNYGPYQFPEKLIPLMILHALEGKPLPIYGTGANVRDWLYVDDHCDAIWAVIERGRLGETYNVGGESERTNLTVVDTVCGLVAEATGTPLERLLALKTFISDRPGHDLRYAVDATKIRRELGWEPRETFATGMAKTVRWYLDHRAWTEQVRSGEYRAWMENHYGAVP
jgi:dTDP-glucose 4,6-dehydratase